MVFKRWVGRKRNICIYLQDFCICNQRLKVYADDDADTEADDVEPKAEVEGEGNGDDDDDEAEVEDDGADFVIDCFGGTLHVAGKFILKNDRFGEAPSAVAEMTFNPIISR